MVGTKTESQEIHTHTFSHNKTVLQFNISILICTLLSFISGKKLCIKIYILKIWVFQQLLGALPQSCIYTGFSGSLGDKKAIVNILHLLLI